ncbi:hypothetical protein, partial [Staphylococcus aureus]
LLGRLAESGGADADAFLAEWDTFIADFGARGPNEYEISAETWETTPELALSSLDRARYQGDEESPAKRLERAVAERDKVEADVRAKLAAIGNDELT